MKKNSGATFRTRHNSARQPTASDDRIDQDDDDESVGSSSLSKRMDQRDRMAFTNAALFSEATTSAVRAGSTAAPSNAALMTSSSTADASNQNATAASKPAASGAAPPVKLVSILSSTGIDDVYNDDGTPRPSTGRKSGMSKKVSWVEGVAESKSANLAVSIPRHKIKDGDHVIYIIEVGLINY
jgi:hypothetical protein